MTTATQSRSGARRGKRNPESDAQAMYESFHGRPSEEMVEFVEDEHFHENLAALGVLVELRVETVTGLKRSFSFEHDDAVDAKGNPVWPFGPGQPLGSRTTVTHIDRRSGAKTTVKGKGNYKGYVVFETAGGEWEVPQIDRESRFDSKKDAQRFIDDTVKYARNPETYSDLAYGNQFQKRGKQWYERLSFRSPRFSGKKGDEFGSWEKVDKETVSLIERMLKSGKIVKTNPGPVSSALGYGSSIAVDLDKRLGKAIGFKGNPVLDDDDPRTRDLLYREAQKADDAYQAVLEKEYGKRAGDMRYRTSEQSPTVRTAGKRAATANDQWRRWMESHRHKSNPEPISTTTTLLCSNESGTQLYFVGGDQSLDLDALKFSEVEQEKELITIGECFFVSYLTQKDFDNHETIVYEHELGEMSGVLPTLIYDRMNKRLMLSGGEYHIERPMFETSPGIEN